MTIVKKPEVSGGRSAAYRLIAVAAALATAAVVMALMGHNPFTVFYNLVIGSTATWHRFVETMNKAIPLAILSLGVSVAFTMKFWNIGAEGQFYMGAFGATYFALYHYYLPPYVLLPLMLIGALLCGGAWALIAALLKVKLGTSETLVTLMLNYIAVLWVGYLQYGLWKDPTAYGFAKIARFGENATLPKVGGVNGGWVIALLLAALIYLVLRHTKLGFEISVMGENRETARYAGINLSRVLIVAALLSGGLCGVAGMVHGSAVERSLSESMSSGLGFTSIITAWLANLSPPIILVTSFLFAMLLQGGVFLQSAMGIPSSVSDILQGIILFFVLGSEFFIRYRIVFHAKGKEA